MARRMILVVDDERLTREVLATMLESDEVEVRTAESGAAALELAAEVHPQTVLIDLMMPGMDGFDLCRRLRSAPGAEAMRIIVVTARDDALARKQAEQAGADGYLVKPYSARDLFATVEGTGRAS